MKDYVEVSRFEVDIVKDLSLICFDNTLNCFWVISDESKKNISDQFNGINYI